VFVWKERKTRQDLIGHVAGGTGSHGYLAVSVFNRKRLAHRLAWFYVTGKWPSAHIDHIDGNKSNNCFANLREVTRFENLQNMRQANKRNKTRLLGVSAHQGKWRVQIMTQGQRIRVSGFNTPEEAHQKYLLLKREFHLTCTI
tara:strand:+ start:194 stop:622 length:429 start_codon:yes stop_codon:yes gene_type:complete